MSLSGERVAQGYLDACRTELHSLKPGNVHVFAGGHRMSVDAFEASARASVAALTRPELSIGERIYQAVRRTRDAVGCNTNLGIVLLCAPLAAAAMTMSSTGLREALRAVLAGLDAADADRVFAAIRLAAPAGLGDSAEHDVRLPPTATLSAAMAAARDRDLIARQYATGFAGVFELGLPRLRSGLARWGDVRWAMSSVYLGFLATFADTHIARKFGAARAEVVRQAALPLDAAFSSHAAPEELVPHLLAFDAALKAEGVNPGTSADLAVASLFALRLAEAAGAHSRES